VNDGKAHERVVQLGGRQDNFVEIVSGVKAGERVITSGYQEVINGQPVAIARK
jgi:multidrug efflux pump subunit AcrA (membrane-fusion protein)